MSNKVQCRTRLQMLYWFFFYTECNIYRSKYNTAFRIYKNVRIMEFLNNRVVNFPVRNFIYSITDQGNCQPVSTLKNSILSWLLNYIDFFIRAILQSYVLSVLSNILFEQQNVEIVGYSYIEGSDVQEDVLPYLLLIEESRTKFYLCELCHSHNKPFTRYCLLPYVIAIIQVLLLRILHGDEACGIQVNAHYEKG